MSRHSRHSLTSALLFTGLVLLMPVRAAAEPLTISSAMSLAVESSHQISVLERSLDARLAGLGIEGYLDGISLTLSGSLGGNATSDATADGSAGISADLLIVPQIMLNASLDARGATTATDGSGSAAPDPLSASIGLTLSPFADPTGRQRDILAAEAAATDLDAARASVSHQAALGVLDAVVAQAERDLAVAQHALLVRTLDTTRVLYEHDRKTAEQLTAAESAVRSSEQQLARSETAVARARATLSRLVSIPSEELEIPAPDALELGTFVRTAAAVVEAADTTAVARATSPAAKAEQDVRSAELDLRAAKRFSPRLSVTASGGIPDWRYEVSAHVTVSPDDWDADAVDTASDDLIAAQREYDYVVRLAELDVEAALNEVRFSVDDCDAARGLLDDARRDLAEAELRWDHGDITELERDRVALTVTEREHDVLVAMIDVARSVLGVQLGQF